MSGLIVSLLWAAVYIVILVAVIYVILWAIRSVIEIPPIIERAIWVVVVLLVCIALVTALAGGSGLFGGSRHTRLDNIKQSRVEALPPFPPRPADIMR